MNLRMACAACTGLAFLVAGCGGSGGGGDASGPGDGACRPETDKALCARLGRSCGPVTAFDNCEMSRAVPSCGDCDAPATCGGGGVEGACGCTPEDDATYCTRQGRDCGAFAGQDNCGAARTATCGGDCTAPQACIDNACGCAESPRPQPAETPAWGEIPHPIRDAAYRVTGDVALDLQTCLAWQRAVPAQRFAWQAASDHCAQLDLGGASDWRLPTHAELASLVDPAPSPSINDTAFPGTPAEYFWTASHVDGYPADERMKAISFGNGATYDDVGLAEPLYVRCVR